MQVGPNSSAFGGGQFTKVGMMPSFRPPDILNTARTADADILRSQGGEAIRLRAKGYRNLQPKMPCLFPTTRTPFVLGQAGPWP